MSFILKSFIGTLIILSLLILLGFLKILMLERCGINCEKTGDEKIQ